MLDKLTNRSFLSPVVAFTFIPVALSGILMLFHIHLPGIKSMHEWVGLAFAIFSSFHIAVNWKSFAGYLNLRSSRYALFFAVALTIGCCIIGFNSHGHGSPKGRYSLIEKY